MGAIADMVEQWDGARFRAGSATFRYVNADFHLHATDRNEIVILKDPWFLGLYEPMFEMAPTNTKIEFGVFEGGSIILFALAYPSFKFVGIDIRPPSECVLRHIHDLGLSERVKLYHATSQADEESIERIKRVEFGDSAIGLVCDDASHDYALSRRSFEIGLPMLAPGGFYCLEDWAWAHWGEPFQTQQWVDQPALTNLVFEMLMLSASTFDVIKRVEVKPALVTVERGGAPLEAFRIDPLIRMRGRSLTLI